MDSHLVLFNEDQGDERRVVIEMDFDLLERVILNMYPSELSDVVTVTTWPVSIGPWTEATTRYERQENGRIERVEEQLGMRIPRVRP